MGIPLILRIVTPEQIDMLREDPDRFEFFFYGPSNNPAKEGPRIFSFIWPCEGEALPAPSKDWRDPAPGDLLDMDRSYEVLHTLLTGASYLDEVEHPMNCFMNGGEQIPTEAGPAWVCPPGLARELLRDLQSVSPEALRNKFESPEMQEKLEDFDYIRGEEDLEYVLPYFESCKNLPGRAVESSKGVLFHMLV